MAESDPRGPRRLGIMGGTFDPVHMGHLVCAEEARWQFGLDEVLWVPAGLPWQKQGRDVSPAEDRYMMTVLGTQSNQSFSVSRIEIDRGGATYTLETLGALRRFYGDKTELFFITGTDAVMQILTWKDPEAVLSEAHFIAASRPEFDVNEKDLERFAGRLTIMRIPALAISSTDIRTRVAEGRPISYLVPTQVERYIFERGLYQKARERSA